MMLCPRCNKEIDGDVHFCPNCGLEIKKCPNCHHVILENDRFCSQCGTPIQNNVTYTYQQNTQDHIGGYYIPLQQTETYEKKQETEKNFRDLPTRHKVNIPALVISVIVLVSATIWGYSYLVKTNGVPFYQEESQSTQSQEMKVDGKADDMTLLANINQGGRTYFYKDKIYVVDDEGQLMSMDTQFANQKNLVKSEGYVSIVNDVIYYTNEKNQLCSMDLDGKDQKVLVNKKAYYVVLNDQKIYYQSDTDNEEMFVYDLKTNKNTQLNTRRTYNINIIQDKIYYTSTDGIYCMDKDGKNEEMLLNGRFYTMTNDHQKLYYSSTDYQIYTYDLSTKKSEVLVENAMFLNMDKDYIYYSSSKGLMRYDRRSLKSQNIMSANVSNCEVIGDKLFVTMKDYSQQTYSLIMEKDGSRQERLFKGKDETYI